MRAHKVTDKLVRVDQVMQLYSRLPLAAGVTFIVATILVVAQWPVINHSILLGWWSVLIVITFVRWWLVSRYRRAKPATANIEPWAARFFIGAICSGLAWGAAGFLLFPEQHLAHQVVLILVMAGMASAAVTTLASVWEDIIVFLGLMLIPLMLRFLLIGTRIYLIMGALVLLYLIGLLMSARRMYKTFLEIINLRISDMQQEAKLLEGEEKYREVVERSNDGIGIVQDGLIKYANKRLAGIAGYSVKEIENTPFADHIHPDELPKVIDRYKRRMAGEEVPSIYITIIKHKNRGTLNVEVNVGIIKYQGGPAELVIVRDITDRKRAEEALRESEEKFRNFVETSADLVFRLSRTGHIEYVSPRVEELYGYHPDELIGKHLKYTTPIKEVPRALKALKRVMGGKVLKNFEINQMSKSGQIIPMEINAVPIKKDGKIVSFQGIMRDITAHKKAEEQIKLALREKEILLKEIHHRVKNNLQTISSLLSLQAGYIKDKQALKVFKNSQERVRAMALIHEKLYQSGDLAEIDFAGYVQSLVRYLFDSGALKSEQVQLKIQIEDVVLDINTSMPVGLIINELVANSFKHAFPDNRKGELQVYLGKSEDDENENEKEDKYDYDYTLIVRDNGIGFPEGLDFRSTNTLGMLLVGTLVKQLHGVIDLERNNGTTFTIKFKKLKHKTWK
jgi:PAS domain S-box-containing protein